MEKYILCTNKNILSDPRWCSSADMLKSTHMCTSDFVTWCESTRTTFTRCSFMHVNTGELCKLTTSPVFVTCCICSTICQHISIEQTGCMCCFYVWVFIKSDTSISRCRIFENKERIFCRKHILSVNAYTYVIMSQTTHAGTYWCLRDTQQILV